MSVSKSLLHFAFVAAEYGRSRDIARGLAPLFIPIISEKKGELFSPMDFCKKVEARYGIKMHPYVADFFAERFADMNLLERVTTTRGEHAYRHKSTYSFQSSGDFDESTYDALVTRFCDYAKPLLAAHKIVISGGTLESALEARLRDPEFATITLRPDRYQKAHTLRLVRRARVAQPSDGQEAAWLDFLVASFLHDLHESDDAMFSVAASASAGAMLAEVVGDLQSPPKSASKTNAKLIAVIDGPLVMDMLGFSDDEHTEYAKSLLDELRELGIRTVTLPHVLDEVQRATRTTFQMWKETTNAYGPLAIKLRTRPAYGPYVVSVLADLPGKVQSLGIEIYSPTKSDIIEGYRNFNEPDEKSLAANIGFYNHDESRIRDAASVATVMRLRRGAHPPSVLESNIVFVTRNRRLASLSFQHLVRDSKIAETAGAPCVTDRHLAGLIWMVHGGMGSAIAQKRLIANCAAAIQPRRDVVTKMVDFLADIDADKAAHFEALMTSERASLVMMQKTLGDITFINAGNVEEIFSEVRKTAADEVRAEKDLEIAELRDQQSRTEVAKARAEARNAELVDRIDKLHEKVTQNELHSAVTEDRFKQIMNVHTARTERLLNRSFAMASRDLRYLKAVFVSLWAFGTLLIASEMERADIENSATWGILVAIVVFWAVLKKLRVLDDWQLFLDRKFLRVRFEHYAESLEVGAEAASASLLAVHGQYRLEHSGTAQAR